VTDEPLGSPPIDPDHTVVFVWGGLRVTLTLARMFAGFWLTILITGGCFYILVASNNPAEEQAAIAILSSVTTAWITALTRR
jgi:hypothetical protein